RLDEATVVQEVRGTRSTCPSQGTCPQVPLQQLSLSQSKPLPYPILSLSPQCSAVMNLRASALVRRFRHRAPDTKTALIKTVKSKNGNMRLRILPKNGRTSPGGTEINYEHRRSSSSFSSSTDSSSSSSSSSPSPPTLTPIQFIPDSQQFINDLALNHAISLFLSQSAFSLSPAAIQQVTLMHNSLFEAAALPTPINCFLLGSLSPLLSV
ncbi:hypothetical protein PMAYCL1PPCAC_18496, partial [Pristionchus mayeri]